MMAVLTRLMPVPAMRRVAEEAGYHMLWTNLYSLPHEDQHDH
jgi:hypothetical protein